MTCKKTWLVVLTLVLVFTVAIVNNIEAQTDARLNGTWVADSDDGTVVELILNNGNFEQSSINRLEQEESFSRGTYTASNGRITIRPTHMRFNGPSAAEMGLVSGRWYTIAEFTTAMRNVYQSYGMPPEIINQFMEIIATPPAESYTIAGNTLTITVTAFDYTDSIVYRRR